MMTIENIAAIELNDNVLENVTAGKGYYNHASLSKLIKKKSLVNLIYWLLFDDKKKTKSNPIEFDWLEYDDEGYAYEY